MDAGDKDTGILSEAYVSRQFLEPYRFGKDAKYLSTDFVYGSVGEMRRDADYADGSIQFSDGSSCVSINVAAYKPEEIENAISKVDTLEAEVMDFCAKMRGP